MLVAHPLPIPFTLPSHDIRAVLQRIAVRHTCANGEIFQLQDMEGRLPKLIAVRRVRPPCAIEDGSTVPHAALPAAEAVAIGEGRGRLAISVR